MNSLVAWHLNAIVDAANYTVDGQDSIARCERNRTCPLVVETGRGFELGDRAGQFVWTFRVERTKNGRCDAYVPIDGQPNARARARRVAFRDLKFPRSHGARAADSPREETARRDELRRGAGSLTKWAVAPPAGPLWIPIRWWWVSLRLLSSLLRNVLIRWCHRIFLQRVQIIRGVVMRATLLFQSCFALLSSLGNVLDQIFLILMLDFENCFKTSVGFKDGARNACLRWLDTPNSTG